MHRLRQFAAVADELSITRAAASLHLTQQAVSSTIKTLERDLKVRLFERSGRKMTLTPAGTRLFEGTQSLLDASRSLARATQESAAEGGDHLAVGYTPDVSSNELFDLTAPLRRRWPLATITVRHLLAEEIAAALKAGTIDVAYRRDPTTPTAMTTKIVSYTPLRVVVAASHRHARRPVLSLGDLTEDTLIVSGAPGSSAYTDFLVSVCRGAGFEPRLTTTRMRGVLPTSTVIGAKGFAFVTEEPGPHHRGQVVVVPIKDGPLAPMQAIWLQHTASRLVRELVSPSSGSNPIPDEHRELSGLITEHASNGHSTPRPSRPNHLRRRRAG
ncbi:LysR family transcriptional regulator [Rhodococcus sovatensis]|uniref:LysR family transcriptional regulator n=1 Tax=Rhodococcus sovatensis TaxID=1805840 RepID=A0ABZ2PPZ6_9NOCA